MDSLFILQNSEESWIKSTIKLPYGLRFHGAQFLNGNLYIFGGENEKWEIFNSLYRISEGSEWEKIADMNQKRSGISNSSVILNNCIWVLGGWCGNALKSVERYCPTTEKWQYME